MRNFRSKRMIQAQCDHCDEWFLQEYGKKDRLRSIIATHEHDAHPHEYDDDALPANPAAWLAELGASIEESVIAPPLMRIGEE